MESQQRLQKPIKLLRCRVIGLAKIDIELTLVTVPFSERL